MVATWLNIEFFAGQNGAAASVLRFNDFMAWATVWRFRRIAWLLNAGVRGWAATFGSLDQTINLFALTLGTVWLFDNRAV